MHSPRADIACPTVFSLGSTTQYCQMEDLFYLAAAEASIAYPLTTSVPVPAKVPIPVPMQVTTHDPSVLAIPTSLSLSECNEASVANVDMNGESENGHSNDLSPQCQCTEGARVSGVGICSHCKLVDDIGALFDAIAAKREQRLREESEQRKRGMQGEHLICGYCGNVRPSYVARLRALGDPR